MVHPRFVLGLARTLVEACVSFVTASFQHRSTHDQVTLTISGRDVDIDWFVFDALETFYPFGLAGAYAPENLRWYEHVRSQAQ
jgi:hypothetical protein